jgi:hypothetical protein
MQWVNAADLHIDPTYQRSVSAAAVRGIVRRFDPDIFGVLTISMRSDGRLYVIDGQHRLRAIQEMGWSDQDVPCVVYSGLTSKDEARIFTETQRTRRKLSPQNVMKADLSWGNNAAMEIANTVEAAGFRLNLDTSSRANGQIAAIGSLRYIDTQFRDGLMKDVLGILAEAWGTEEGPRDAIIAGLAIFLSRYEGKTDRKRVVRILAGMNPERVITDGRLQAQLNGLQTRDGVGRQIWTMYNHKLHHKLPPWDSGPRRGRRPEDQA